MKARSCIQLRRKLLYVAVASCFSIGAVQANPTGGTVVKGGATFANSGKTLTVTNTPNAIINWQQFSIGRGEITRFVQQSSSSAVLNRVVGGDPSQILGSLLSNGKVFLINPNGILFGKDSVINVGALVASSLKMSDADFLAGRLNFTETPGAGKVRNDGSISTATGGQVYLIAPDVTNTGVITSPQGEIILAAGRSVFLVDPENPLIQVQLTAPANKAVNVGKLVAEGGKIGVYGGLVRNGGIASADSAVMQGGKVVFRATQSATLDAGSVTSANGTQGGSVTVKSDQGTTWVSGDVSATGSQGKGGDVKVLGQNVGVIDHAVLDASGELGGGSVLVGGDYRGANPAVQNAAGTWVGADASIRADAITSGDGGKVVVWADDATRVYGSISARGGAQGGNGGFVETSGHFLDVLQGPDVTAAAGNGGTWLLDPFNITIISDTPGGGSLDPLIPNFLADANSSTISNGTLTAALESGASVVVDTAQAAGSQNGDVTVNAAIDATAGLGGSLTILADGKITVNQAIDVGNGNLSMVSDRNSTLNAGSDSSKNGGIDILASLNTANNLDIVTYSGNITIGANAPVLVNGSSVTVTNNGSGDIRVKGGSSGSASTSISASDITLTTSAGKVSIEGGAASGASADVISLGALSIQAGSDVILNAAADRAFVSGSDVTVTADGQIKLQGGTATGATASINAVSSQTITTTSTTGDITLQAGSADGANAYMTAATQTVNAGRDLKVLGGTAAGGADAFVSNVSATVQTITAGNQILVKAANGASGAKDHNRASIFSSGQQNIQAGSGGVSVQGGAAGLDNVAQISANGGQTIASAGNVIVNGGAGAGNSSAYVNTSGTQNIYFLAANKNLNVTGGSAAAGNQAIVSGNLGQWIGGWDGVEGAPVNDPNVSIQGGSGGVGTPFQNAASLFSNGGVQEIYADSVVVKGGSGFGNGAFIQNQNSGGGQKLYIGTGGLTLQGGSGAGSTNNMASVQSSGYQHIESSGDIIVKGGTGTGTLGCAGSTSCNAATIETGGFSSTMPGGYQEIYFTTAGSKLELDGGTAGTDNYAEVGAGGGTQTIQGWNGLAQDVLLDPSIVLKGGGGVGNDATISTGDQTLAVAGAQTIFASSITMTAGSASLTDAAIGVDGASALQTVNVSGNIAMTGGTASNAVAGIGSEDVSTNITIVADSLTMTGKSGNALIGALGAGNDSTVDITAAHGITLNTASGAVSIGSEHGTANVTLDNTTGTIALGNATIGGELASSVSVTGGGSITMGSAIIGSSAGAATVVLDTTSGTGNIALGNANITGLSPSTETITSGGNITMASAVIGGSGGDTVNMSAANGISITGGAKIGSSPGTATLVQMVTSGGNIALGNGVIGGDGGATIVITSDGGISATGATVGSLNGAADIAMTSLGGNIALGNSTVGGGSGATTIAMTSSKDITLGNGAQVGSTGGAATITMTAGTSDTGGDINLANAQVGTQAASVVGTSVFLHAGMYGGGISEGDTGVIRASMLSTDAHGGGVSLVGDNVVTGTVDASDAGDAGKYGNVVANLMTTDALNGGAASIPTSVTLSTGQTGASTGHLAQVGFIGADVSLDLGILSLSGDGMSIFGTGNLTVSGTPTLNGGTQGTNIRAGAGKDLTLSSAISSVNSLSFNGKNITTNGLSSEGGSVSVNGSGAVVVNGSVSAGTNIGIAGSSVTVNSSMDANNISVAGSGAVTINTTLDAHNNLNINGGSVLVDNADLIATNTMNITGVGNVLMQNTDGHSTASANNINILAGTFTASDYSFTTSNFQLHTTGNVTFTNNSGVNTNVIDVGTGGDMFVDNNSIIHGTPDVDDLFIGGKLYLDTGGRIESGSPASIYLDFPNLTSGGYIVEGVEGAIKGPLGSGFYANGNPAVLNVSLHVTYQQAEFDEGANFIVGEINDANQSFFDDNNDDLLNDEHKKKKDKECS